ncbi:AAA family ATPase [Nocardioides litoris]|uniref:AAA family ATPase n=1 Tax=Nocardioides litoris TaxID=1926648 RepID=UPI001124C34E|nr:ATP-binding protein [Nocardioides litoris]
MSAAELRSISLEAFKSHYRQQISLRPVTLLVGRNGSGKSNVLDALSLLALLADERDVNDLERGDQEVAGLRGGLAGAAPFGEGMISVGCTTSSEAGQKLDLKITLDPTTSEIVSEKLVLTRNSGGTAVLIDSSRQARGSGISDARVYSAGAPRTYHFLSSRLATAQATTKVPQDTQARKLVVQCCLEALGALKGAFLLDPAPSLMRDYVRIGTVPDRTGRSLSAMAYELRNDDEAWQRLLGLVSGLIETQVEQLTFSEGRLPDDRLVDVMLALDEVAGGKSFTVPARLMSDGTLRYLSIVATLLFLRQPQSTPLGPPARTTLVIEEIENGLFPSQGAQVLELLRNEASTHDVTLLATTHSPALLDAMEPADHRGVVICERDNSGRSQLRRLVDHPRYVELVSGAGVGQALTRGKLRPEPNKPVRSIADIFAS